MVSVAVLALAVVPMLITREYCWDTAYEAKVAYRLQELAKQKLAQIALEVTRGEGSGTFESDPAFGYEYDVTVYDFASGLEEREEDDEDGAFDTAAYSDAVFDDSDPDEVGSLMARHVILTVIAPSQQGDGKERQEYILETYLPVLMTRRQWDRLQRERDE